MILLTVGVIYMDVKNIHISKILDIRGVNSTQEFVYEDLEPIQKPKVEEVESVTGDINVPIYWKYSVISESGQESAIHGYVPDLSKYLDWYEYVYSPIINTDIQDIDIQFDRVEYVKGITNGSDKYSYDPNICNVYDNIAICPLWISLTNRNVEQKEYVLVECPKFGTYSKKGYCLFEDYRGIYYNFSKDYDIDCVGENTEGLYCDIEQYLNIWN